MGKHIYRVHRKAVVFGRGNSQDILADGWKITKEYDEKLFILYAYDDDGECVDMMGMPIAILDSFEVIGVIGVISDTVKDPSAIVQAFHDGKVTLAVDPAASDARQANAPQDTPADGTVEATRSPS